MFEGNLVKYFRKQFYGYLLQNGYVEQFSRGVYKIITKGEKLLEILKDKHLLADETKRPIQPLKQRLTNTPSFIYLKVYEKLGE